MKIINLWWSRSSEIIHSFEAENLLKAKSCMRYSELYNPIQMLSDCICTFFISEQIESRTLIDYAVLLPPPAATLSANGVSAICSLYEDTRCENAPGFN